MFADQALASLRIETSNRFVLSLYSLIRLSRACGLKQDHIYYYDESGVDQALASLRIETVHSLYCPCPGNRSGSREPAD